MNSPALHRLGALESPSSGPGVPVQCLNQPRLFVKPKAKSNRTVVVNAISHCCLAGTVNEPTKQLALKVCLTFFNYITIFSLSI